LDRFFNSGIWRRAIVIAKEIPVPLYRIAGGIFKTNVNGYFAFRSSLGNKAIDLRAFIYSEVFINRILATAKVVNHPKLVSAWVIDIIKNALLAVWAPAIAVFSNIPLSGIGFRRTPVHEFEFLAGAAKVGSKDL
jgi:hypothetical protein